jgi:hypothetical protein
MVIAGIPAKKSATPAPFRTGLLRVARRAQPKAARKVNRP